MEDNNRGMSFFLNEQNSKEKEMKIEIELEDLDIDPETKKILADFKDIPIFLLNPKLAIVDEMYFIQHKVSEEERKAIFKYVVALNNYINKSQ